MNRQQVKNDQPITKKRRLSCRRLSQAKSARNRRQRITEVDGQATKLVHSEVQQGLEMDNGAVAIKPLCDDSSQEARTDVRREDTAGMKREREIVRGTFHQGDLRFSQGTRGKQCTANAAAALAMCNIKDPRLWDSADVDAVLTIGDDLYAKSIKARNDVNPEERNTDFLTATELCTEIEVSGEDRLIQVSESWLCGHLHRDFSEDGFPDLRTRLVQFLSKGKSGILTSNLISVAVFRTENGVWMFDSHSRSSTGHVAPDGRACLTNFPDAESLCDLLMKNIPPGRLDDPYGNQYDLTAIEVVRRCEDEQPSRDTTEKLDVELDQAESSTCVLPDIHLREQHSKEQPLDGGKFDDEIATIVEEERLVEEHDLVENHRESDEELQDGVPTARGIYSFEHVWTELHDAFDEHCREVECSFRNLRFIECKSSGLKTVLRFRCSMCHFEKVISSEPEGDRILDINESAVLGSICSGIGYAQLQQMLGAMNLKCMAETTFQRHHDSVYAGLIKAAESEMKQAGEEERRLAIERGDVINGIPHIAVVTDGSWMKRSYKLGKYDSSSGLGAIVGLHTQKVLYVGTRNKSCAICDPAFQKGVAPREHTCYKNWGRNDSSTGMESDAILEGFKSSIEQHGLIYSTLIADGDSSVYKKITDYEPYRAHGVHVEKIECANHLIRNVGTKLKEFERKRGVPGTIRNLIKNSVPRFNAGIRTAIRHRKNQDVSDSEKIRLLRMDIANIPSHVFGEHAKCASIAYFCDGRPKPNEQNFVPQLRNLGLMREIEDSVARLGRNAKSLIRNVNNNTVESFNGVVAKFIGAKRIHYGKRNSYNARALGAAVQYNSKKVLTVYRDVNDKIASEVATEVENKSEKKGKLRKIRLDQSKENNVPRQWTPRRQTVDKDYGPRAQQPGLSPEDYAAELDRHLTRLKEFQRDLENLERNTVDQSDSLLWLSTRKQLLTASKFGKVCLMRKTTSCRSLVQSILFANNSQNIPALEYGRNHEETARLELENKANVQVVKCGLFVDPEILGLGASPDGLIGDDGIVEIKCPYSARDLTPDEAIAAKISAVCRVFKSAECSEMNEKHEYYYQVQGQLHITRRNYCLFMLWTPKGSKIVKVIRDDKFFDEKMKPHLVLFYETCLLPEIVDSCYLRSMEIREPEHILKAQELAAQQKRVKVAKVIAKNRQSESFEIDSH